MTKPRSDDHGAGVPRSLPERAKRKTEILPDALEPPGQPHITRPILRKGHTSKCAPRGERGLPRLQAALFELLLFHRTVDRHLLGEITLELASPEEIPHAWKQLSHERPTRY